MLRLSAEKIYVDRAPLWARKPKFTLMNASVELAAGELVTVIGPNGAGKSTLIKALCGERPYSGNVRIGSQNIYQQPLETLSKIGYVPTDNVLPEFLTVAEALVQVGRLYLPLIPLSEIQQRASHWLDRFNVPPEVRQRQIRSLSSGERKRVNICAELLADPDVLVLDEPTSNLDPNAELLLMQELRKLTRDTTRATGQQSILVVTHTLNHLMLCDRVYFVARAHVQPQSGLASDAITRQAMLQTTEVREDPGAQSILRLGDDSGSVRVKEWAAIFEAFRNRNAAIVESKDISGQCYFKSDTADPLPHTRHSNNEFWHQFKVMLAQNLQILLNQPLLLLTYLAPGLVAAIGLVYKFTPDTFYLSSFDADLDFRASLIRQAIFGLALVVTLASLLTVVTSFSRDATFYKHARLKGLSIAAYLLSRLVLYIAFIGILTPCLLLATLGNSVNRMLALGYSITLGFICGIFLLVSYQRTLPVITGIPQQRAITREVVLRAAGYMLLFVLTGVVSNLLIQALQLPPMLLSVDQPGASLLVPSSSQVELTILISLIAGTVATLGLGLAVATLTERPDVATAILGLVVIFSVLFALPNEDPSRTFLANFSITRWIAEGIGSGLNVHCWVPKFTDRWRLSEFNSIGLIGSSWLILAAITSFSLILAWFTLRWKDTFFSKDHTLQRLLLDDRAALAALLSCVIMLVFAVTLRWQSNQYAQQTYDDEERLRYFAISQQVEAGIVSQILGPVSQSMCVQTVKPKQTVNN